MGFQPQASPGGAECRCQAGLQRPRSEHVTDALVSLHWLRIAERIRFKVAVLAHRSITGVPPSYLHGLVRLFQAERPGLCSASSDRVMVPRTRSLIGNRAFPVSGAEVWNNLPPRVTSATNLSIFRTLSRHFCFLSPMPDLLCSSPACCTLYSVWRLYYISFLLLFLLFFVYSRCVFALAYTE